MSGSLRQWGRLITQVSEQSDSTNVNTNVNIQRTFTRIETCKIHELIYGI